MKACGHEIELHSITESLIAPLVPGHRALTLPFKALLQFQASFSSSVVSDRALVDVEADDLVDRGDVALEGALGGAPGGAAGRGAHVHQPGADVAVGEVALEARAGAQGPAAQEAHPAAARQAAHVVTPVLLKRQTTIYNRKERSREENRDNCETLEAAGKGDPSEVGRTNNRKRGS